MVYFLLLGMISNYLFGVSYCSEVLLLVIRVRVIGSFRLRVWCMVVVKVGLVVLLCSIRWLSSFFLCRMILVFVVVLLVSLCSLVWCSGDLVWMLGLGCCW